MGPVVTIEDPGDDRLADYQNLTDAELWRGRDIFIAEGVLVVRQLLRSRYPVRSVLVTPAKFEELEPDLPDAPVFMASPEALGSITGFHFHRGALAVAERLPPTDVLMAGMSLVAVLEGVNDHENLGALFRNAAAFGVDAVLLSPSCADPLYRRSVRVSMGHVLRVPWATLSPWPAGLENLKAAGYRLVALTPDPRAEPLVAAARPTALLLGSEGHGLSAAALEVADARVRIPMASAVDSLNVATAAAIAFHAYHRGRGGDDWG